MISISGLKTERVFRDIDVCVIVVFQKIRKTASVVIMAVRKNDGIHCVQIDMKEFGVFQKQIRCAGVKQQPVRFCFNVQAKPVLSKAN